MTIAIHRTGWAIDTDKERSLLPARNGANNFCCSSLLIPNMSLLFY